MRQFPHDFIWGTATSSYQIEGGVAAGGRGLSIWDVFSHTPGKTQNGDTGDIACDHFHRFREDVRLLKDLGVRAYRFSIAWPRIQPTGSGPANPEGIRFYSELIDLLLENDITPWATLYHWDLPVTLQLEKDGWLNPEMADFFAAYARICFEAFGDRVKNWITLNEPWVVAMMGYGQGVFAPGRTSDAEPYRAAQELLRAHGRAVRVFREEFQPQFGGQIGISNNCDWREPLTDSPEDREAAVRALEFYVGWFADPIYLGDYPASMRERVGDRLPTFSDEDRAEIVGSSDFFGLNHYTTMYAAHAAGGSDDAPVFGNGGISADQDVALSQDPAWPRTTMGWSVVPWGCRKLLGWLDARYGHPPIVITENGCSLDDQLIDGSVDDRERIDYLQGYLEACHDAIGDGVDLRGYFVWSFLDNFEWALGYSRRFGLHYVEFATGERTAKASAGWYRGVIDHNGLAAGPALPATSGVACGRPKD
jgi:beta-galactosidase